MAILLKRIRGLNNVRLVDASYIWTEEHSRRIKVKTTVQKEVHKGVVLQQEAITEFTVDNCQCPDCAREYTAYKWEAVVQVRQKVDHKRTFFYLEQLILKHQAALQASSIAEESDGVDFFFLSRSQAIKFVHFLKAHVPCRFSEAGKLITHNEQNATATMRYSLSVEIIPLCRDDLVILPKRLSTLYGSIGPLCLVARVSNVIQVVDPQTLQVADITAENYWRHPFKSVRTSRNAIRFAVIDIERDESLSHGHKGGQVTSAAMPPDAKKAARRMKRLKRFAFADAYVLRDSDFTLLGADRQKAAAAAATGDEDMGDAPAIDLELFEDNGVASTGIHTRTHLGNVLHVGDDALGYYVKDSSVATDLESMGLRDGQIPDIVLFKKHYDRKLSNRLSRSFRLKRLVDPAQHLDEDMDEDVPDGATKEQVLAAAERARAAARTLQPIFGIGMNDTDHEAFADFMDELVEDPELRAQIDVYAANDEADTPLDLDIDLASLTLGGDDSTGLVGAFGIIEG
jgi:nonsense-mediated mRNA decay protein 3